MGVSLYWHAQRIETLLPSGKRNPAASIMFSLLAEMALNERDRSVGPELDDKIYDLEMMPSRMNKAKGAKIGVRQKQLAGKWRKLGLLSEAGFLAVMTATK